MKRTVRENIIAPYSLHDMHIIGIEEQGDDLIFRLQTGMIDCTPPSRQVDGHVEFQKVDWDFCFVYLLSPTGNTGTFQGEKLMLRDLLRRYPQFGFSVIDETYGDNQTKYAGYLIAQRNTWECMMEIYHLGDMVFVEE